jgi:hypothetical protein
MQAICRAFWHFVKHVTAVNEVLAARRALRPLGAQARKRLLRQLAS